MQSLSKEKTYLLELTVNEPVRLPHHGIGHKDHLQSF